MAVTGPAELSAAATLIEFWHPGVNPAVWYTVFIVAIFAINLCGVRIYGEVRKQKSQICIDSATNAFLVRGLLFAH